MADKKHNFTKGDHCKNCGCSIASSTRWKTCNDYAKATKTPLRTESKTKKSPMDKVRKPTAKGTITHKDKNTYSRKEKHKKPVDVDEGCKKKKVKESIERPMRFKDLVKLVIESGGQQQIDPVDEALWDWAARVASVKESSAQKQEIYAGLLYERMGGTFQLHDILSENK